MSRRGEGNPSTKVITLDNAPTVPDGPAPGAPELTPSRHRTTKRYGWEPRYGFTSNDPEAIAAALEVVRRRICAYGPDATTCDCKYGRGRQLTEEHVVPGSEQTGCPELRSAIWHLLHGAELADPLESAVSEYLKGDGHGS